MSQPVADSRYLSVQYLASDFMRIMSIFVRMNTLINCNGQILDLTTPKVMGILNVTPDSFYDGGRLDYIDRVDEMVTQGVDIIDIGGMSTRPGAEMIGSDAECNRIIPIISKVRAKYPDLLISIDTVYGATVRKVAALGVHMINDVSAGGLDPGMLPAVAASGLPYVLMHMQGTPADMQRSPTYHDVVLEVATTLRNKARELRGMGIKDIIIDPGFGFGKELSHNYALLDKLDQLSWIGLPILAGLSRKSMIYKALNISSEDALVGTIALNMLALQKGATIIRVHDVQPAKQQILLYQQLIKSHDV